MNQREQRMIIGLVPFLYDGKTFAVLSGPFVQRHNGFFNNRVKICWAPLGLLLECVPLENPKSI